MQKERIQPWRTLYKKGGGNMTKKKQRTKRDPTYDFLGAFFRKDKLTFLEITSNSRYGCDSWTTIFFV
jgi:hypothetical protein